MKKFLPIILIIIVIVVLISLNQDNTDTNNIDTIECLKESGVVIYGTATCPACLALVENFGGRAKIDPIYIECNKEEERCMEEMQTNYVPEIQIKGKLYEGPRDLESILKQVNCK